jgi:tRNA A-37 threonylcarbamoyl transferase component Bud32
MQKRQAELEQQTEALRKEWTFLKAFDLDTEKFVGRSAVFQKTIRIEDKDVPVFIKVYSNKKHPLQRMFRQGKSRTEARNLLFFQSIDIPTPRIIAWGNRRNRIRRIVEEFIITEAISDAQQLDHYVPKYCPDRSKPEYQNRRDQIIQCLGGWTRRMHAANFIHEDLKWRNILARTHADEVSLFWIDCPKGYFAKPGATLTRKKLKDCATLDKIARIQCSKAERQTFIKAYLDTNASNEDIQQMCQQVEAYRKIRFDAKDNIQREHAKK